MKRSIRSIAVTTALAAVLTTVLLTGCAFPGGSQTLAKPTSTVADQALEEIAGQVFSKGPNGETASPPSSADLTDEEVAQIKSLGLKAAIVMHTGGDDWSQAQINGLNSEFERLGIEVVATTDAKFDPKTQVANLQTVMAKKPDIIVSLPTDPVATAAAYQKRPQGGAKLVFMDNIPDGFEAGKDYVSAVSADNYGNGVISAHLMAKALGGQGKIGVDLPRCRLLRHQAALRRLQAHHGAGLSGHRDRREKGIGGPDFATQAQNAAAAMLSKHSEPGRHLGGLGRAGRGCAGRRPRRRAPRPQDRHRGPRQERRDRDGQEHLVVGLGAQVPFDQGVTEARLAAGAFIGKQAPPYVALPALAGRLTRTCWTPGSRSTTRIPLQTCRVPSSPVTDPLTAKEHSHGRHRSHSIGRHRRHHPAGRRDARHL